MLMSAALSTARRNVNANNFDPEFLRFMERDPLDPLYADEDADEGEDEGHGDDEAGEPGTGKEEAQHLNQPKDEKDILIDQLKEELKK